jgi:protein-tyrosine phosphatase
MAEVVDWHGAEPGEAIERAAKALRRGGLVVFPTDTHYSLAALATQPQAVARLKSVGQNSLIVALRSPADVVDWLPDLGIVGRRLARRCWPGPLTLVADAPAEGKMVGVPEAVRGGLCGNGSVSLRVPAHNAVLCALRLVPGPVLFADTRPKLTSAEQALAQFGDQADLIINDGARGLGNKATVVRVEGESWKILEPGLLSAADLEQSAACRILFVCTGNTCRSPLAQALCSKLLAERLGCTPAELPRRGFIVQSAGLAAMMGAEATPEAVTAAREFGADLTNHRSQPLSRELLEQAHFLFAMTRSHLHMLLDIDLPAVASARLLCASGEDIPDPIGSPAEVYRLCAQTILHHLEALLPELR